MTDSKDVGAASGSCHALTRMTCQMAVRQAGLTPSKAAPTRATAPPPTRCPMMTSISGVVTISMSAATTSGARRQSADSSGRSLEAKAAFVPVGSVQIPGFAEHRTDVCHSRNEE